MLKCSYFVTHLPPLLEHLLETYEGILTVRQATQHGINRQTLVRATKSGMLERVQRGVYRQADAPIEPFESLLEVQLRIPIAVICQKSALAFHDLTTFIPKIVEISVPRDKKIPALEYPKTKVYFENKTIFEFGIEVHTLRGQTLRIYSPEKTLMDLLRRKQEALFAEGMKRYLLRPNRNLPTLLEAARVCRLEARVMDLLRVEGFNAGV
jgi:predicted transcriptional regulator of viral defense system